MLCWTVGVHFPSNPDLDQGRQPRWSSGAYAGRLSTRRDGGAQGTCSCSQDAINRAERQEAQVVIHVNCAPKC